LGELTKTAYNIVHNLFSAYFHKLSWIAYTKTIYLYFISCYRNTLYTSAYHDKRLCYKLQISCLSKQPL